MLSVICRFIATRFLVIISYCFHPSSDYLLIFFWNCAIVKHWAFHSILKFYLGAISRSLLFLAFKKKQPSYQCSGRVSRVLCAKSGDKIHIDSKALGGLLERGKYAVFWQTGRYLSVFSTRTEKEGFTGFPVCVGKSEREKEPETGVFSRMFQTPYIPSIFD